MYETVAVMLVTDRDGLQRMLYAANLASRLGVTLSVLAPTDPVDWPGLVVDSGFETAWLSDHLGKFPDISVEVLTGSRQTLATWVGSRSGCLAVTGMQHDRLFHSVPRIYSADEGQVCRSGRSQFVMPFGKRLSASALTEAVGSIASRLGVTVNIYHTTWPDPRLSPEDPPYLHMAPEARESAAELARRLAPAKSRLVVELAPAVTAGIHQYALASGSCLIAMTTGERVVRGSYVDELIKRSSVPVLFVPREGVCQ